LCLTTILGGMAAPINALAQDVVAPQATAAGDATATQPDGGLGEIIVTATRQSESIQKVPISLQALSSDTLAQRQVKGMSDFAALLPSVSFEGLGPGRNTAFFRGIVPAGGEYASVGYYLDDIPITGTAVPDIHVYDMQRIEALAGPQGTLYGAGSLAGTIRFITNKPKIGSFEFGADLEGNKYGKGGYGTEFQSYINIPVSDTFALRAMGYYRHDGGYVDNVDNKGKYNNGTPAILTLGDDNPDTPGDDNPATTYALSNAAIAKKDYNPIYEYGGRLEALWEPAPDWTLNASLTTQRQIAYGYFGYDPRLGDLKVHDYDQTRRDDKWYQAALTIHGHIGDFDLVSATGYFGRRSQLLNDYAYYTVTYDHAGQGFESYLQFFDKAGCTGSGSATKCTTFLNPTQYYHDNQKRSKFTQEIRLTTPKSWPFDITLGGFYQRQKNQINQFYAIHNLDKSVGYTQTGGGTVAGGLIGVPAKYAIGYDDAGVPFFDTTSVIDPTGNPLGTMILGQRNVRDDGFYIIENDQYYHDEAIFAEGHYKITPTLKITGGIRYFWTDFSLTGFQGVQSSALNAPSIFLPNLAKDPSAVGCPLPLTGDRLLCRNTNALDPLSVGRYKEHGETHKIAVDWQFQPDKMIYANYSTGFRPGGYNRPLRIRGTATIPAFLVATPPYESEKLTNYELGVKATFNHIFRINASIYLEKWSNIQYSEVVSGAQGANYIGNAGNAEVRGFEYDADLKLGKVTISTSGAYNDGKLKGNFCAFNADPVAKSIVQLSSCTVGKNIDGSNPPVPEVAAADGTRLPRQPKFKGTTSIRYDSNFGEYKGYLQGAALYQTGATQDLSVDNDALLGDTSGFVSFDFSAGIAKEHWSLDMFIQNAFDRRGELTRNTFCSITFCSGSSRAFTIRPQFFGLRVGYKY